MSTGVQHAIIYITYGARREALEGNIFIWLDRLNCIAREYRASMKERGATY